MLTSQVDLGNVECAEINHGRCRTELLLVYMPLGEIDPIKHFRERFSFCEASVSFWKLNLRYFVEVPSIYVNLSKHTQILMLSSLENMGVLKWFIP